MGGFYQMRARGVKRDGKGEGRTLRKWYTDFSLQTRERRRASELRNCESGFSLSPA